MSKKDKLLSIGDLSKYSGASKRSLRYYEQMKILKPIHIDASSGYRYYSIDQLHHVWMIMFCIELGIPLKELARLTSEDNSIDLRTILNQGKLLAETRLKSINRGLKIFEIIERQMDLSQTYENGQIYQRKIEEKVFYIHPCDKSQAKMNQLDVIKVFNEMPFTNDEFDSFTEFGIMYEHTPLSDKYYFFVEIPSYMNLEVDIKKIIPAGIYLCCLNENGQINNAVDIFKEHLYGRDSYLVIEMEIMANKYEVGKPFFSELRVLIP